MARNSTLILNFAAVPCVPQIDYPPFKKNFYIEHEELSSLTGVGVVELRQKLNLKVNSSTHKVSGAAPPKPATSFAHFGFDEQLMHQIRKSDYTQPTPIQCQGVPISLSGRDMIGIAKTGSGKTVAFIWPMLVHIMDQKELEPGEGPIAVIVCPTRELCQQIHAECKRFGKVYGLRSVAVYGGGSMWEQAKALQEGAEIVVCTPGRLINHVKKKATSLQRVTYLVFDEADRMFDMGFVVNYDVARDIDTHTHRIGRTGRAGEKGVAYTLLTTKDTSFAGDLVRNLEGANQSVSKDLMDLAMQNPWFRKSRFTGGKGKKINIGGGGLGYRERPGLGSESTERSSSGGAALGNYEAYKPSTGAMGDRMSALKQAFQAQYKNHFVAASGVPPKLTTKSSSSSGWTSAGSLSSLPSGAPEGPDRPHLPYSPTSSSSFSSMAPPPALSSGTKMSGFSSAGSLSSVSDSYSSSSSKEGSRSDRNADDRGRHGDSHYRHGDRHSGVDRDRYGERDRYIDRDRHGDSRNGEGSHRDREGRSERDGGERSGTHKDSFAVPDPPKRKKSRWDN
ncbi:ATP-dependent RNA helicase DDX42-like [Chanodichthys erythropterus]|uniref:ATP-dependent RNA helicase DDX42-like n=1 Tax=Chanodichthys erythropterus TaxID=933992 RepID=UPI00351DDDDD